MKAAVKYQTENPRLFETYDRKKTKALEVKLRESDVKPDFDKNSYSILEKRYIIKDKDGALQETPHDLIVRVAANVAYPDLHYDDQETFERTAHEFYELMAKREFMPNSPTLMNAGRYFQQLAGCYVLPMADSIEEIYKDTITNAALIHKTGGGTGFTFAHVRRKNDGVSKTHGLASGELAFVKVMNESTSAINQGGFRRGANMGIQRCDRPGIYPFLFAKEHAGTGAFSNFNFSVAVTQEFMDAVENGGYIPFETPRSGELSYLTAEDLKNDVKKLKAGGVNKKQLVYVLDGDDVIFQKALRVNPENNNVLEVEKLKIGKIDDQGRVTLDARIMYDYITKLAWKNGDPGILFIDRVAGDNPTPNIGEIESTNPCGEQPLLPFEACNLGSINVGLMYKDGKIDWDRLEYVTKTSVHFLDNVVDMNKAPLEEIIDMIHGNRKIGLGVMGVADLLARLKIAYNSEEGLRIADKIMGFINEKAKETSIELAKKRGVFPNWKGSVYDPESEFVKQELSGLKVRNAGRTTIAPTGTIGIIASASGGMEPFTFLYFTHTDSDEETREFKAGPLEDALIEASVDPEKVFSDLGEGKSLQELDYVPDDIKRVFVTSEDISPEYHVKMQAIFQKHTDAAVSKTVNLPNSATEEEIQEIYKLANDLGCKGITVFRDGCRDQQVLNKMGAKKDSLELLTSEGYLKAKKRPDILYGFTAKKKTGCGNLFVTVNSDPDESEKSFETFINVGKAGGCAAAMNEAVGRLVSYSLRRNADPSEIASQLIGISCHKPYGFGEKKSLSCVDSVGKIFAEAGGLVIPNGGIGDSVDFNNLLKPKVEKDNEFIEGACEECGAPLTFTEGCRGGKCSSPVCGYSTCS